MKLNLATRLFAAVLSTAVVVAVAMGVGAHVNLNRDFLGYLNEQAVNRLDLAVPERDGRLPPAGQLGLPARAPRTLVPAAAARCPTTTACR